MSPRRTSAGASLTAALTTIALLSATTPAISQQTATGDQTGSQASLTATDVNGVMTVDNNQSGVGDVSADASLSVTRNDGLSSATAQATGNALQGGNDQADAALNSVQNLPGSIRAAASILGVNAGDEDTSLGTPAYASSQAIGNYLASTAQSANLSATASQTASGPVSASARLSATNNAVYVSGEGDATAQANHAAFEVEQGRLVSDMTQTATGDVRADFSANIRYSPSPNAYSAFATGNDYAASSYDRGSQDHTVSQSQSGATVATSSVQGGNLWQVASQATAAANNVDLQNAGGAMIVDNSQSQTGPVTAQSSVQADQYGEAHATASGVGNQLAAGNNDIYLRLDNNQISSGGVDVSAAFDGGEGYDGYVTADATGNQALAYACAECQADYGVNSTQVNNSNVSATATASVAQGRSIVATARATGNSATYYVSK